MQVELGGRFHSGLLTFQAFDFSSCTVVARKFLLLGLSRIDVDGAKLSTRAVAAVSVVVTLPPLEVIDFILG